MAKFATKHEDRQKTFGFRSFTEGLNTDVSPLLLPTTALSRCRNMKYAISKEEDGTSRIILKKRQGTSIISNSALPASADVMACTYFVAGARYILATSTHVYYLDDTFDPVEIGDISGIPTFTEFHSKLIIHDGGITKALSGTTPSIETLNCLYTDELIGTGDGSTVDFTGTLSYPAIKPSSLTITYTDTTAKTITDDGVNALTGDVTTDTNTINLTTGLYYFRCSGAPDNTTPIYATYEKVNGAPKSKAGTVRASQLYMWGDPDNVSRLWYCGPNDEDAWHTSSSGGYLDIDLLDGYDLTGCLNFFQSMVLIKENSIHRLDNFPGDSTFRVEPLMGDLGCIAYRSAMNDGNLISFLSPEGYVGMSATERYGDIQKSTDLSEKFKKTAVRYANSSAYSEYNQIDKQLWLSLYDGTNYLPDVYVLNLSTGGQLSLYEFVFDHSCFKYVNGEMLIGGKDGNLYKLVGDNSTFLDNGVSYSDSTQFRSGFTDWDLPFNRKHNKEYICHAYGQGGVSANLKLFKDQTYLEFSSETLAFTTTTGDLYINPDGNNYYIYDLTGYINTEGTSNTVKRKFNYRNLMFEVTDIEGTEGAEFYGMDFVSAVIGG